MLGHLLVAPPSITTTCLHKAALSGDSQDITELDHGFDLSGFFGDTCHQLMSAVRGATKGNDSCAACSSARLSVHHKLPLLESEIPLAYKCSYVRMA